MSESAVEKVGDGVRSASRSLTQPWNMGELNICNEYCYHNPEKQEEGGEEGKRDRGTVHIAG